MDFKNYLQQIQIHLIQTHSKIFDWFDKSEELKNYRPKDNGWTIKEILEHISLTSHYLLILIDKGANKALKNINNLCLEELHNEFNNELTNLESIGLHKSFPWIRPEHMEPMGNKNETEIKSELIQQLTRCLNHLESLKNGEGLLYKTTMSVNDLGKLNVYEYLYFLSKHAERHIQQMIENKKEYTNT